MIPDQIEVGLKIGDRIEVGGHRGTIEYIGDVVGTKGEWVGVDWDDPTRGKHNGSHNNKVYFKARHSFSGSFIRSIKVTPRINCCEAIQNRYGLILDNAGVDSEIIAQLQKDIKAALFEVVGAEKVNKKQSDLGNLRVVSLRGQPVWEAGPAFCLHRLCPNIEELDLSQTLINSWAMVASISRQLPCLKMLDISDNYLTIKEDVYSDAFASLEHLVGARAQLTWQNVIAICQSLPKLQNLQIPFNNITSLGNCDNVLSRIVSLHIEGNALMEWSEVNKLGSLKNLTHLNVSGCQLTSIDLPCQSGNVSHLFPRLNHLLVSENDILNWTSLSELDKLASLQDLRCLKNPFLNTENPETNHQLIVARIQRLQVLNGSAISNEERRGAELDFLKRYGSQYLSIKTKEESIQFHGLYPCYQRLVNAYGAPELSELKKPPMTLREGLVQVELFIPDNPGSATFKKILPLNMTVHKLSGLVQRILKTGSHMPRFYLIHKQMEIPLDNDLKDLNFYSIEDGSRIAVRW